MTLRTLRPYFLTPHAARQSSRAATSPIVAHAPRQTLQSRTLFSSGTEPPASLTASRTLPYPTQPIFDIIADIPAYPSFLPFCTAAKVIAHSPRPDSHTGRVWPAAASLTIGFQDTLSDSFTSVVFCVPPTPQQGSAGIGFVEAIGGTDPPAPRFSPNEDLSHYDLDALPAQARTRGGPLAFLRTRWTVRNYPYKPSDAGSDTRSASLEPTSKPRERTDVSLVVEYRFKNPVYEMMSKAATPKVADMMVEAFEKRVKEVLGEPE